MPHPDHWVQVPLVDIARLESGHTPSRRHPEWWGGDVPWISIPDAREHHGRTIQQTASTTNEDGLANSAARLLPTGTVCLSRTASVGYSTVMGRPMATSQDFVNWVCTDAVDPHWLKHLFIAEEHALKHRFGKGSTHTTIYFPEVKAFNVCLPPVGEQKRIVAKVDALQARSRRAREALDAIPALLDRFRQSVLAAAFRGDLTADWRAKNPDVEPASVLLERIRAERKVRWIAAEAEKGRARAEKRAAKKGQAWGPEQDAKALEAGRKKAEKKYTAPEPVDPEAEGLPELPEGWCWTSAEALCWDGPTNGYSGRTGVDAVGSLTMKLSATTSGQMVLDGATTKRLLENVAQDAPYWLRPGDLLVQRANTLELVGATALFEGHSEPIIYPDLMMRLRCSETNVTRWMWQWFNSKACREYFREHATGTAGNMPKINGTTLRNTRIPLAPFAEVDRVLRGIFESTRVSSSVLSEVLGTHLEVLDQAILAKAFRGELVPQEPTDEPASVLLERIRAEREAAAPKKTRRKRT
jgi:type I restriction enzyme S subunit